MIFIADKGDHIKATLSNDAPGGCIYWDDIHIEKLQNAEASFAFTCLGDHEFSEFVVVENSVIIKDKDNNWLLFTIKKVDEVLQDGQIVKKVYAENAALELLGHIIRPQTLTGATASSALITILSGTRWEPGNVEWAGSRTLKFTDYGTVLSGLHYIADQFGSELIYRVDIKYNKIYKRYVDFPAQRGDNTGKRFEYKKDITGLTRTQDSTGLYTALIGLGKAGANDARTTFYSVSAVDKPVNQDWIGDEEALKSWGNDGRHITGIYEDNEETDPSTLLVKTREALKKCNKPRFYYEIDVLLLEDLIETVPAISEQRSLEHEKVRLGDTVTIINKDFSPPIEVTARVIELQRHYTDPIKDKAVLGEIRPMITDATTVIKSLQSQVQVKTATAQANAINHSSKMAADHSPVANRSFQLDTDNDGVPDNWTLYLYTGGSGVIDSSVLYRGTRTMKLTNAYVVSDPIPVVAGQTVSMKVSLLASNSTTKALAGCYRYKADGTLAGSINYFVLNYATGINTSAFQDYRGIYVVDADVAFIRLIVIGGYTATGTIWVGDVDIDITDPYIGLTPTNNWVYFGAPYAQPGYYIKGERVYLQGMIKNGTTTNGTDLFTQALPKGALPPTQMLLHAGGYTGSAIFSWLLMVTTTGFLRCYFVPTLTPNTGYIILDGLSFRIGN